MPDPNNSAKYPQENAVSKNADMVEGTIRMMNITKL